MDRLLSIAFLVTCTACITASAPIYAGAPLQAPSTTQATPDASQWQPRDDASLRKMYSLPAGTPLLFRDAHGARLSEEAFLAALPVAGSFSMDGNNVLTQLTLGSLGVPREATKAIRLHQGDKLPPLAGMTIDGKPFTSRDFLGHTTLINFLFANCTYCIKEVPVLNHFAAENPAVQTVAITYDDAALMRNFVTKWHFRWPVVAGEVDYVDRLGLWTYPSLALVDDKGRLVGYTVSNAIAKKNQFLTSSDISAWVARVKADRRKVEGQ